MASLGNAQHFVFQGVLVSPGDLQLLRLRLSSDLNHLRLLLITLDLMNGWQKLEPPLFIAKRFRVHHDIYLFAYDTLSEVSLENVAIVLRRSILHQYH